jgi:hypothetical protein
MEAYLDAAAAQDREKLQTLVLLPEDPERRKWVLHVIEEGELPRAGAKRLQARVSMDGPVAVCRVKSATAGGPPDDPPGDPPGGPPSAAFLVRREGQWKVVIDYFQGGGLTAAEMAVVSRHLTRNREAEADDGE